MPWPAFALFGVAFGFVLSRSGAADYDFVQGMFLFENLQLYGVIGTAVAVTAPGLWLLKRHGRTAGGAPLRVKPKARHRGNVAGGVLFGVGWSITGMCPGPIFVNLGEGKLYAAGALAGALVGAALFGALHRRLAGPFGLAAPAYDPPRRRSARARRRPATARSRAVKTMAGPTGSTTTRPA